jgi:hypothetical protein
MKKLLALNILLIVTLFYTGIHLNENEKNFAAGYYPGDNYEWAASAYAAWVVFCTIFATYVAYKAICVSRIAGWSMMLLALSVMMYAIFVSMSSDAKSMYEVLHVFGIYIILGMWINLYLLLSGVPEVKDVKIP